MFNQPSDSPSGVSQAYVHIVSYCAAALAAGIYQGIPKISVPSPKEVGDLNRLWREYFLMHKLEVLSFFCRRRSAVSDDMQGVIKNLEQHTYSLRDPRGDVSCEILFSPSGWTDRIHSPVCEGYPNTNFAHWFQI